jgi:type IV secretion system protein VirB10
MKGDMKDNTKDNPKDSNTDPNPMEELPHENEEESIYKDELEESVDEKAEIEYGKTAVARSAKQNMAIMAVGLLVVGLIVYMSFFRDSGPKKDVKEVSGEVSKPVSASEELSLPSIPDTPAPPPDFSLPSNKTSITSPPIPAPPPAMPATPPAAPHLQPAMPADPGPIKSSVDNQQLIQSKNSSTIMLSNGASGKDGKKSSQMYLENFIPDHTGSAQQRITKVGNMSLLIAQGKVIDTVLETPINTTYPGPVRAIVSSDVYSENGNNVLIPRGSRVIGQFTGGYSPGQTRVMVTWNRIIMPDGYDIAIDSPAVGPIGIMGVEGIIDSQIVPTMTNAILLSAINVAFTEMAANLTGSNNSSQSSSSTTAGTVTNTTNTTPTQQAIGQQATTIGSTAQSVAQQSYSTTPFITVDQGTMVSIFVNRDLLFPSDITAGKIVVK